MRDVLFRGKNENAGWVYGYLNQCRGEMYDASGETICDGDFYIRDWAVKFDSGSYGLYYQIDPKTIGQYTGLTDKNGEKLFEGDIVKYFCGWDTKKSCPLYRYYLVCFNGGAFRLRNYPGYGYLWENAEDGEIAGNIFDNPELKKKVK